jgi:hypothetical protein
MIKNKITLFVATVLITGLFILALTNTGLGGTPALGCCVNEEGCIGCGPLEDCAIEGVDCPLPPDATFTTGEICLGLGANDDECKTPDGGELGCCVLQTGNCNESQSLESCNGEGGDAWFNDAECSEVPQCAPVTRDVPTLSTWGLIALAGILGVILFIMVTRRRKTAT